MKTKFFAPLLVAILLGGFNCNKSAEKIGNFNLTIPLPAAINGRLLIDNFLLNSYGLLDGVYPNQPYSTWSTGTDNWIYGSVAGGEAHKGSVQTDQPEAANISTYTSQPGNSYFEAKWQANIMGIKYANNVLLQAAKGTSNGVSAIYAAEATAEARFLRGFFELEMAKLWRNVPYITETSTGALKNAGPIWLQIEGDFRYAKDNLPATQPEPGRPNKYAAEAFLVKTLLFDHKYTAAQPLLNDLVANGVTTGGVKYALVPYADNFNPSKQNNAEGVFTIQARVHDGSNGYDGNSGDVLNFPSAGPAQCCGFFGPSFSFVNAFKTNAITGLPFLDTYNNYDLHSDMGITASSPYTPTTDPIDPRLDWTAGRRGIPCLDWGIMGGDSWARAQSSNGPYFNMKTLYYKAAQATTSEAFGGWATNQSTSNCYNAIRFADVLLWAAEVEVEVGSLQKAENYVNQVRTRAANPAGWVHTYIDPSNPTGGFTTTPAANYKIGLYSAANGTGFVSGGRAYARKAVYFERELELGMEGHRFFDLQRWDGLYGGPAGAGYMAGILNAYMAHETAVPGFEPIYLGAKFTQNKNELYPIPQAEISAYLGLKQNTGY